MVDTIENDTFVELTYKIIDDKSGEVLSGVEYPIGYVHGRNDVLAPAVLDELQGKAVGSIIEVPIDCTKLYGPRDESLVFTDRIENVPEQYREIGTTITMENTEGQIRKFIVTRMDDKTLTVDANNPLSGREVTFILEVLTVREPTDEELAAGGALEPETGVDGARMMPI